MSATYLFEIDIIKRKESDLSATDLIESFIAAGWSLFSENSTIIFTDTNDIDDYNYLSKHIEKNEYYDIVRKKQNNGEPIAFALFRSENHHKYRIDIIIIPRLEDSRFKVAISPSDGTRKMLSAEPKILDVNWYLIRVIPYLTSEKMVVENFSYSQYYT